MTTFALVHGAWHRASCWEPTAAHLRDAGHDVVAVDLPCDDPAAGLTHYAATVLSALADVPTDADLVVVGHSLGGLTIPLVATGRPVRRLVFLCALVPLPGAPLAHDLFAEEGTFAPGWDERLARVVRHDDGTTSWPVDAAIDAFYHDCAPELAARAAAELRPQSWLVAAEPCPLVRYPEVPSLAVVCSDDRVLRADACADVAVERLGATVVRLGGGHSPMLAQPEALAAALLAP